MAADTVSARRRVLQGGLAALGAWLTTRALAPLRALAAVWDKPAFESHTMDEAMRNFFGASRATPSSAVRIAAPYFVENGAAVSFSVSTRLPEVSTIAVLVEKNPRPLVMVLHTGSAQPYLSLRMKMKESSDVLAVVKSQGELYSARQYIRVTVGGCGG